MLRKAESTTLQTCIQCLLLAWGFCSPLPAANTQTTKPNIVIFLIDDMGIMDTSVPFLTDSSGNPQRYPLNEYYRTPNMERLAARGIRFNQFYAMSVCSPTRISIMTGQNAARHHATNWINPDNNNRGPHGPLDWNWEGLKRTDLTLPGLLHSAGYRTIHVGKGHFGARQFEGGEPLNLGFDVNIGGASFGAPGSYYAEENFGWGGKRENHAVPHLKKYHGSNTFLSEALTVEAQQAVADAVESQKPFYLYFAHYAVHAPFESDPRFAAHYQASGKSPQAQAFATLIEGMDKSVGDMLDQLDRLGVADNTLVIFLGDNGSDAPLGNNRPDAPVKPQHLVASAAPLRGKKGAHYEGGMRVPFIAAWAKPDAENYWQRQLPIAVGAVQTQIAAVMDILPTLTQLTGVELPANYPLDGQPLNKLFAGQADPDHASQFLMHYPHSPHRSEYFTVYRDGDWKVIYHYYPSDVSENSHYQLYNLAVDPFESTNVAQANPAQLQRMMGGLIAALEDAQAQFPMDEQGTKELRPQLP
jgi:arylsulfatase A-like enzyme